jgi:hypothetical protein
MSRSLRPFVLVAVFAVAFTLVSGEASARRRGIPFLFIINTGDVIYPVAELPEELANDPELKGWALGWKCSHFGLLWADIACWNKELVAFKDNTYSELPAKLLDDLEARYPFSDAERNLWNRYGMLLMLAAGIGALFMRRKE